MAHPPYRAFIAGCSGHMLTDEEKSFFEEARPWGFILFARNCRDSGQIRALCQELRACIGRDDAPILIDQEGGRVDRLKPPEWPERPPMMRFGDLYKLDKALGAEAAMLGARLIAQDLAELGVNVNCVPVLDVPQPDAHEIIGDRALANHPETIAALARDVVRGTLSAGVLPIIKHIPGHGRAMADSHLELPVVTASLSDLENVDLVPFRALSDAPMAMTAHVIYTAWDEANCATLSPTIIGEVIRGQVGFDGLLMSDDLSMKALSGSFEERTRAALAAGCDIALHCNGDMAEMRAVAAAAPVLDGKAAERAEAATALLGRAEAANRADEEARFPQLLKPVLADERNRA